MFISEALAPAEIIRNLGIRFREYRMRKNLTQKEVAEMTAMSIPTIYKFETYDRYVDGNISQTSQSNRYRKQLANPDSGTSGITLHV